MQSHKELTRDNSTRVSGRQAKADLSEVRAYMEQHFNEPLTIAQLAEMAKITPKYFVDLFKKTYQQSAMDYLTDLRINRAKRYLIESNERLRDIAQKVGYSDEFYFSRKFKKEVGVSPSDYAKNSSRRVAVCSPLLIGQMLALDIVPCAAPLDSKWTAYYYNGYRTAISSHLQLTTPYSAVDFDENIAQLIHIRPDAILGDHHLPASVQHKLTEIAPSLFLPADQMDWREQLQCIASFLGREEQASQWLQQYDKRVRLGREQLQQALGSQRVLLLRIYQQGLHLYMNRGMENVLHHDLQLHMAYPYESSCNLPFTLEELAELNPDHMLIMICPEADSRAYWLRLQHDELWRQLKAVRTMSVYHISSDPWLEYSATGISRMLDETLLLFTGNCPSAEQDNVYGIPYRS